MKGTRMYNDDYDHESDVITDSNELVEAVMEIFEALGWTVGYRTDPNGKPVFLFAGEPDAFEEMMAAIPELIEVPSNKEDLN